jgi:ABC-type phosphate transport system substrate-binding protein
MVILSKKKTALISVLVIITSLAIAIVVVAPLLIPFLQPRFDVSQEHDEPENTRIATIDSSSNNQTAVTTTTATTTTTTIMPTSIDIVSTTSAFPFVQRWAAQYENQQLPSSGNVNVNYLTDREIMVAERASGSGDLAIVGVPNENNNNTIYIPVSAQAVAIVYNIPSFPDIPSGLRLNSTMLSLILNGSITRWNDAAIKDLNPSLNLPDERIVVVHDDDDDNNNDSSTSSMVLLNQYLGLQSLNWPKNNSITVSGPAELAETVRKTPYSVGYVDFSYAVQTRMTYAAIEDADGNYIIPSMQSIGQAVDIALQFQESTIDPALSLLSQQSPPTINASRIANGSYPIVGLYYASLLTNDERLEDEGRSSIAATLDFVEWIISESGGQQTLLEVQYPPIYSNNEELATYATTAMDKMKK